GVGFTVIHMILFGFGLFPELTKTAASFSLNLASPINAGAATMIFSLIIVPIVSALTKVKDSAHTEEVFSCYNK
ncbi:MAG: sodium:solute symporter, partial [Ruminococcus sp.]|nr:sodium:solute symporter [Ruminococcus sp.]